MKTMLKLAVLALAVVSAAPAVAQGNSAENNGGNGGNKAVHHWNTQAFSKTPPANTKAFAATPNANTKAFSKTPSGNTNAFGTENGGKVTAFGNGDNAFGNQTTGRHNARRMANSFGTGNDRNASPVMPNYPVTPGNGPLSGSGH